MRKSDGLGIKNLKRECGAGSLSVFLAVGLCSHSEKIGFSFNIMKHVKHFFYTVNAALKAGGGVRSVVMKVWNVYRVSGLSGVKRRFSFFMSLTRSDGASGFFRNDYQKWILQYDTIDDDVRECIRERIAGLARLPKISVIMPVYEPPLELLDEAIWSVRNQLYPEWELCIADDASKNPQVKALLEKHASQDERIKVEYRRVNGHISESSNSALALATGEYVALLDHDDLLSEHALFWVAEEIQKYPNVALIYSDEDKITETGKRYEPYFKCEFNPELFLAQNMISHLGVYRRDLIEEIGGFRSEFNGSQDYDLALRVISKVAPEQIVHIPRVLYHWRAISGSTALANSEKSYASVAGRKAVSAYLKSKGVTAEVMPAPEVLSHNRVRFALPDPLPIVSIIIPTRDRVDLLAKCVNSILGKSTYPHFEIIIIDNGSVESETIDFLKGLPKDQVKILRDELPFNFSRLNNLGVREARGEIICLMNNDMEVIEGGWLEEMVAFAARQEIGCVGNRLWYPDGTIQHAGVVLGIGGVASHSHKGYYKGHAGYFSRAVLHQSYSAVTAACLVVRRQVFEQVGGLDEELAVAFNDVDFCLRVRDAGYRNLWTPYADMIHHESASRGLDDNPVKRARFKKEVDIMHARWGEALQNDPAYSPNLTLWHDDFSLAWPPRIELLTAPSNTSVEELAQR
ncbi:glycosyltransferase family 2 protein [Marichromatium bheemlicum]|nr:glycosyltransferase [Marichromatium bheemlicum]